MQTNSMEYITIDRRSTANYDIQLKDNIKALILDRTMYYQTKLPQEDELASYLGIDLADVKTAYLQLVTERLIKNNEEGYHVSYIELTTTFFERNTSIYDAIISLGLSPSIKCIEKKVMSLDKDFIREIGFDEKEENKYLYINRIYYGDEQPIIILENYLPIYIFKDIDTLFKGHEPLNNFIGEVYGFKAHISKRVTKAVNMPKDISVVLNERSNASSLRSTNHVYDIGNRLIDYGQSYSISSYYFQTRIKREEMKNCFPEFF